MSRFSLIIATAILLHPWPLTRAADTSLGSYWHDGLAELDGYRMTISRYGQPRHGQGVLVYVTEPFSESKRVKVDDPRANPSDTIDVLKLNIVRDFQTGIYDYNTMVSVFDRTTDLAPVKLSFSSAEWCGHVYNELLFYPKEIKGQCFSYFENESAATTIEAKEGGISEDNLFVLLRGLRDDFLKPGDSKACPLLPSVYHSRLAHRPLGWAGCDISRAPDNQTISVPAGKFATLLYEVRISDGRVGKFWIEHAYPHRIVRWELAPDVAAEMTGSARLKYWQLHNNGDESYLKQLGLKPTVE